MVCMGHSGNGYVYASLLCDPQEHRPLLSMIHLFSYVILDLVAISGFLYLWKILNLINIEMPHYLHANCFFSPYMAIEARQLLP